MKKKVINSSEKKSRSRPALTPAARENYLVSLAYDLVEERLLNGTATSQETTCILKLGTEKAQLENEKLKSENELLKAKADMLNSQEKAETYYKEAIDAFRKYSGSNFQ